MATSSSDAACRSLSLDLPLLPGLPADLAMLCLAKLPLDAVARSRSVSRTWASALCKYPPLGRSPQLLAVFCRGKENDRCMSWLFLSRSDLRSLVIPFFFMQKHVTCIYTTKLQIVGTGMPLLLVRAEVQFQNDQESAGNTGSADCRDILDDGHHVSGSLQAFDVWRMKWVNSREIPCGRMPADRWMFATAYLGSYVYFAGGEGGLGVATSAERLWLDTWTWETLPPMHKERTFCPSGFAMGGRFFVVGGESDMVSGTLPQSGEFYDPTTNAWTLVPDMWPHGLWWAFGGPQTVVVIEDVGYAIDHNLQAILQLKMENPSTANMKWQMVGQLPFSELDQACIPTMPCLLSTQDELWAILNLRDHDSVVFACKPHLANHEGLHWERLPFSVAPSTRSTLTRGMDITI